MLDPFPFSAPESLRRLVAPVAKRLALPTLPLHVHEVLFALACYTFIAQVVSPLLSSRLFPRTYPQLSRRNSINWDIHVVSLVQSLVVIAFSFYILFFDEERKAWTGDSNWEKRIWGYSGLIGLAQSFALGYFLWDLFISIRYVSISGWGMVAHAICTCVMFTCGYAINGVCLVLAFFGARLVYGTYGSIAVFKDVYRATTGGFTSPQYLAEKDSNLAYSGDLGNPLGQTTAFMIVRHMPLWLGASYLVSNVVLTLLNFFWFSKMIETIRKRFDPPLGTKGSGEDKIFYEPRDPSEVDQKKVK